MFGLGAQEVILLVLIGLCLVGVPLVIVLIVVFLARKSKGNRMAELEEENRRLREEREQDRE